MFLMKAQFMHDIFQIDDSDQEAADKEERKDSSILQVL